jgi:hypothetical protein
MRDSITPVLYAIIVATITIPLGQKIEAEKTGILSSSGVARSGGATTICRTLNLVHRNGYEPINDWSPGLTGRRLRRITTKSATLC